MMKNQYIGASSASPNIEVRSQIHLHLPSFHHRRRTYPLSLSILQPNPNPIPNQTNLSIVVHPNPTIKKASMNTKACVKIAIDANGKGRGRPVVGRSIVRGRRSKVGKVHQRKAKSQKSEVVGSKVGYYSLLDYKIGVTFTAGSSFEAFAEKSHESHESHRMTVT
ncbi:hypothetical protein C8F01DRAFT_1094007 [Mycena amicta]|nr:hypothetical protein C8F01DRAFT_1094007 [Mycena amicta]